METNLNDLESFKNLKAGHKGLFKLIIQILLDTHLLAKFFEFLCQLGEKILKDDEKKTE